MRSQNTQTHRDGSKIEWWLAEDKGGRMGSSCLMGKEFQFGIMKKIVMMVAQQWECIYCQLIIHQ